MSSDLAVSVRQLSKHYTIDREPRSGSLAEAITGAVRRSRPERDTFCALTDVSFDVERGDVVGIIGRNGAGKSTLLKILSRITEPSAGEVRLHGSVGALLEVGTGFHPELTGRENVYLNGAMLGMGRREIGRLFEEIVAFAEVERFIDTPVKRYSSGMYVRLAFAVAAHVLPEVLIVDEVLAVGDTAFQRKCLGRMSDAARDGRTVLFVSHNLQVVNALCTSAVLLERGRVVEQGPVQTCVTAYQASLAAGQAARVRFEPAFDDLGLLELTVDQPGEAGVLLSNKPTRVSTLVRAHGVHAKELVCGLTLVDEYGNKVLSTYFDDLDELPEDGVFDGDYELRCVVPAHTFNEGRHRFVVDLGINKVRKATTDDLHVVDFDIINVAGVGARFGLGREWRDTPLLPAYAWDVQQR